MKNKKLITILATLIIVMTLTAITWSAESSQSSETSEEIDISTHFWQIGENVSVGGIFWIDNKQVIYQEGEVAYIVNIDGSPPELFQTLDEKKLIGSYSSTKYALCSWENFRRDEPAQFATQFSYKVFTMDHKEISNTKFKFYEPVAALVCDRDDLLLANSHPELPDKYYVIEKNGEKLQEVKNHLNSEISAPTGQTDEFITINKNKYRLPINIEVTRTIESPDKKAALIIDSQRRIFLFRTP